MVKTNWTDQTVNSTDWSNDSINATNWTINGLITMGDTVVTMGSTTVLMNGSNLSDTNNINKSNWS